MKKVLFYSLAFLFTIVVIGAILFYPLITPHFGLKPMPVLEKRTSKIQDARFADQQQQLEESLFQSANELQAPAISVAIGVNNRLIWANALGHADIAAGEKASPSTQFRIGSVSKSVTSLGMGKLLEEGKLDLDAPVQDYVPYFGSSKPDITIRQLASHTSGIRNYSPCFCFPAHEGLNNDQFESIAESIAVFGKDKLLFEPGSDFSYATYNYTLISGAMEEISGVPFLDYMRSTVFQPLNMEQTMGDWALRELKERATFYDVSKGKYKKAYAVNSSNKWAGGGMLSTPSDLVKMGNALLNNTFLSDATKAILWEPVSMDNGEINPQHYAIGWRVDATSRILEDKKVQIIHHGGTITGSITLLMLFPEYNMSIAMMVNRTGASGELFNPIYELAKVLIPAITAIEDENENEQDITTR